MVLATETEDMDEFMYCWVTEIVGMALKSMKKTTNNHDKACTSSSFPPCANANFLTQLSAACFMYQQVSTFERQLSLGGKRL